MSRVVHVLSFARAAQQDLELAVVCVVTQQRPRLRSLHANLYCAAVLAVGHEQPRRVADTLSARTGCTGKCRRARRYSRYGRMRVGSCCHATRRYATRKPGCHIVKAGYREHRFRTPTGSRAVLCSDASRAWHGIGGGKPGRPRPASLCDGTWTSQARASSATPAVRDGTSGSCGMFARSIRPFVCRRARHRNGVP
jgi:hypothetical protein